MKKLLLTTMVLGSTVAVAACSGMSAEEALDGGLTNAPYTEERTIGATGGNVVVSNGSAPAVRSAEPVFTSRQVK